MTIRNRLPAISAFREFADAGGLLAYGPDLKEFFRRSALYVAKTIEGAKPGDLPIEQPTKFQLVIDSAVFPDRSYLGGVDWSRSSRLRHPFNAAHQADADLSPD